jgi:hypothetical protein
VPSVTVSTFKYDVVRGYFRDCRVTDNGFTLSPQISCSKDVKFFTAFFYFYRSNCRTKDMPCIVKFKCYSIADKHRSVIRYPDCLTNGLYCIFFGKQGSPVKFFPFFLSLFLQIFCVASLNVCRVHHDKAGNIP